MDKQSNRTDLIAAGRKKLQQYRQKNKGEDGKGSSKSSNKADGSQHKDAEPTNLASLNAESSQPSQPEVQSEPTVLETRSGSSFDTHNVLEESAGTSVDSTDVSSAVAKEPLLDGDIEPPGLELTSVNNGHESHSPTGEGEGMADKNQAEGGVSLVSSVAATCDAQAEGLQKGDQVSIVGAIQEADSYGLTYHNKKDKLELLVSDTIPTSDQHIDASESGRSHRRLEASVHVEATSMVAEAFTESPSSLNQQENELMDGSSKERVIYQPSNLYEERQTDSNANVVIEGGEIHQPEACTVIEVELPESMSKLAVVDSIDEQSSSAGVEGNSVDLVQLAEMLKRLPDGDIRYLLQLSKIADHGNLDVSQTDPAGLPQTFQEQLYLANVSKDFYHVQLLEQHKQQFGSDHQHCLLFDEASVLNTSVLDLQESNRILAAELAQCRSELEVAVSERAEFQDRCHHANEEAKGFSTTVVELRIKLDAAVGSLSVLSVDLDHCKAQLEASLVENEELLKKLAVSSDQAIKSEAVLEQYTNDNQKFSEDLADSSAELAGLQQEVEKLKRNLASATDERKKFEVETLILAQDKEVLSGDLLDCRRQLSALQHDNSDLNQSLAVLKEEHKKQEDHEGFHIQEIERLSAELVIFHEKLSMLHQENMGFIQDKEVLSGELVDCRLQITMLQHENSDLKKGLAAMDEEHKKHMDHEESLILEIERLSAELVVFRDKLSIQYQENIRVEAALGEAMSQIEQLAEENIILHSSLEIYKAKISEVERRNIHISFTGMRSMTQMNIADSGSPEAMLVEEDADAVIPSIFHAPHEISDGSAVSERSPGDTSVVMKGCLEKAENLMRRLEKTTDGMHSHAVSLSRSIGRNSAPGVSKLIQAFESKANVDDPDPELNPLTDNPVSSESYSVAKEQINHLRSVIKNLARHVEDVDSVLLEEKVRFQAADISRGELEAENDSLKGMCNNLEMRNIELEVLCVAMNQHAHDTDASKTQLENVINALKLEYGTLQSQNVELYNKLATSNSRISELQVLLKEIRKNSSGVVSTFYNEIETVQGEMNETIYAIERGWKSALSQLYPAVEKLDALVESAVSYLPSSENTDSGILDHLLFSIRAACELVEKLRLKVETHETLSDSYMQVVDKLNSVDKERSLAVALLQKVSAGLVKLLDISPEQFNDSEFHIANSDLHDIMDADYYEAVVSKVGNFVGELQELKESNRKLYSDLLNRTSEIEELNKYCLDSDAVLQLVLDVKDVLNLQDTEMNSDNTPIVLLQSSVLLLMQRFKETEERSVLLTKECNSRGAELGKLQDNIEQLDTLNLQHQDEMLILKESLVQAKNAYDAIQAELLEKTKELEQADQRVASVREKLSIAVAKGKGLVVQRDGLKNSLVGMSSELDKCCQELLLKDSRILEVEEKLKAYSEAGERMEALESELTYIRNSATALRESFLMKDSALQRIEEIMEDLELPDHFHSKDTVEKVDWLAKSVAGNLFLHADWDQRSSVGGGSYSDAGLVTDGGKEDFRPTLIPVDDLRRQYDELQTKYYELAEQNDMLEQSLMERNVLVQRWEEVLDRINTPTQIRSMEPEERIHWLGTALSEADHHMRSLQQKIENLENYCESLSRDLEESQRRISELQSSLHATVQEKDSALSVANDYIKSYQQKIYSLEHDSGSLSSQLEESERRVSEFESSLQVGRHDMEILSSNLVALTCDREQALHTVALYEHDLDRLREEVDMLQGCLVEKLGNDNHIKQIETELTRLQGLILEVLQDSGTEDGSSDGSHVQCLERLITKLVTRNREVDSESHAPEEDDQCHVSERDVNAITVTQVETAHVPVETAADVDESKLRNKVFEGQKVEDLRTELGESLVEVARLKKEIDEHSKKYQSMAIEFEALDKNKNELQELLNQEEQKSASLREKLNLAVRKGKSLVQQRDSLKQNIEQATREIYRLKSEISLRDNSLSESGQKINDLLLQIEAVEDENFSLKNRLIEAEQHLQQNGHTLSMLLNKLGEIGTGGYSDAHDPLLRLEGIGNMCSELRATATSFEQDAMKSKKAAELLLAELNEVQERNDGLQEELARTSNEVSTLSRERDLADSAKVEALSHLAKFSDEKNRLYTEIERLKFSICQVKKVFFDMSNVADDAFANDLEFLTDVKARVESSREHVGEDLVATKAYGGLISANKKFKDFWSRNSWSSSETTDLLDDSTGDVFKAVEEHLKQLTEAISEFKGRVHRHSMSFRTEADQFNNAVTTMLEDVDSRKNSLEFINGKKLHLESLMNEQEMEVAVLRKSLAFLYEACCGSIMEIVNRKAQLGGQSLAAVDFSVNLPPLPSFDGANGNGSSLSSSEECIKELADILMKAVKDFVDIEIEDRDSHSKEMRSAILDLQKELQEKDIQRERICMELVGQIKVAENTAANCSKDLQSAKNYAHDLEIKLDAMGKEHTLLQQRVVELQHGHVSSIELGEKVKAMTDMVAAKEQEIEALMHALDEEENQMETLRSKIEELECTVQQKNSELELADTYRAKAVKKLSITVSKFDELHCMSEGLLAEVEDLQSQLQDRDSEISFLRQEVTRCTNDVLEATEMSKVQSYADLHEFLTWSDTTLSRFLMRESHGGDHTGTNYAESKEKLQKDITSLISEVEDSRIAVQNMDALLQAERNKVEELSLKKASLELSLNDKELQLNSLQGAGISGLGSSEIVEVEPVVNKWTSPVSTSQVRSWRKPNSDQVAIAIDADAGSSGRFEDEDDDKVHGFKSLTTSRFVPKFTRPVSDMIDGLWVSCDRALMRQPAFRLGIMFYWALLHALLASVVV